jgi:hypothetical protein
MQITRLSETFHFDASSDALRAKYDFLYYTMKRRADAMLSCLLSIPSHLLSVSKTSHLFFVFYVYKAITSDADTMLAPYTRGSIPKASALLEATARLYQYRAPIALGLCKLNEETENVCNKTGSITIKTFPIKGCVSDSNLLLYINNPTLLTETSDIEIKFLMRTVGQEDQVRGCI